MRAVDSLDLVDREKLIQQITSVQTLSGTPPGNPPIHDWKDVRGLFFTPCHPRCRTPISRSPRSKYSAGWTRSTASSGIRGILRVHRGKGYFVSPDSGGFNEYHIEGGRA